LNTLVDIHSDADCWTNDQNIITKNFAVLVNFSPKAGYGKDSCSVHIASPWWSDIQNGFGLFLPQTMDCSTTVTIECLPGSTLFNRVMIIRLLFKNYKRLFYIDNTISSAIYVSYKPQ
jgi:hypothetical protein